MVLETSEIPLGIDTSTAMLLTCRYLSVSFLLTFCFALGLLYGCFMCHLAATRPPLGGHRVATLAPVVAGEPVVLSSAIVFYVDFVIDYVATVACISTVLAVCVVRSL